MDDMARGILTQMLSGKRIPQALIDEYDVAKVLNDRASGGQFPLAVLALMASKHVNKDAILESPAMKVRRAMDEPPDDEPIPEPDAKQADDEPEKELPIEFLHDPDCEWGDVEPGMELVIQNEDGTVELGKFVSANGLGITATTGKGKGKKTRFVSLERACVRI